VGEPVLSVVIPVFNECAVLDPLFGRLFPALERIGEPFEVIVVDDGSTDETWEKLREARSAARNLRLFRLSRNFGQQAAITAGMDQARGRAVVLMDADLQDPPELVAGFVEKWREGCEIVYGVRARRREGILKRMAYHSFYRILGRIASLEIPKDAGDFCLMDRRVVDILRRMPERNRFLRGLRSWVGFRQAGVSYDRPLRCGGKPSYTFYRLFQLALDGIVSFSYLPLRLSAVTGALVAVIGIGFAVFAAVARIFFMRTPIATGWASMVVLLCLIGGTQLIVLGIMGEYLARIYDEVKQRPSYVIRDMDERM